MYFSYGALQITFLAAYHMNVEHEGGSFSRPG